jgi:hypothetical protein
VDAAYKLRVEGTRKNELCFVTVVFECMRRENGDLEVPLIDRNSAVHDDDYDDDADGATSGRARAYLISCVGGQFSQPLTISSGGTAA